MVTKTPIMCPECNKDTGMTEEGLRYFAVTQDLCCPHCAAVVIPHQNMWSDINDRKITPYFFEPVKFKAEIKL